jgi:membrane fusion protein, type I secretion system
VTPGVSSTRQSIRQHLLIGASAIALLVAGVGGWAAATDLVGAIIAQGQMVVESNDKKVQHPTGGVVGELRVREGSRVKANDILIRLDDTQTRASLAIVTKALDELFARQARDEAERDGAAQIAFSQSLLDRASDPDVAHVIAGERKLFDIRRAARAGQVSQLRERIAQLKEEIQGTNVQQEARGSQIEWIHKELEGVNNLWAQQLVAYTRVTSLQRDAARLEGERGQLIASIAQSKGKIAELELQIIQVDQDMRAEVGKDIAEIRGKLSELGERKIAAEDQLRRIDIRSPLDGVVHQLNVHTVGGVITAGEAIMYIVPDSEALTVEVKIQPQDIDQVHVSQAALLRFPAFSQRTTPELTGTVTNVSPDVTQDQKTGASFYTVRISVGGDEIARLGGVRLIAGMPVEAFVQTGERNVMSYLMKPFSDQLMRAFREK